MTCFKLAKGREDTPIVLMDRVYGEGGALINQASINSISYRVFEYADQADAEACESGTEVGTAATLNKVNVVFDTLQTAPPWRVADDAAGYNFRFTLPAARRPNGSKWHRAEVLITPSTSGEEAYSLVWIIQTTPLAAT